MSKLEALDVARVLFLCVWGHGAMILRHVFAALWTLPFRHGVCLVDVSCHQLSGYFGVN